MLCVAIAVPIAAATDIDLILRLKPCKRGATVIVAGVAMDAAVADGIDSVVASVDDIGIAIDVEAMRAWHDCH